MKKTKRPSKRKKKKRSGWRHGFTVRILRIRFLYPDLSKLCPSPDQLLVGWAVATAAAARLNLCRAPLVVGRLKVDVIPRRAFRLESVLVVILPAVRYFCFLSRGYVLAKSSRRKKSLYFQISPPIFFLCLLLK